MFNRKSIYALNKKDPNAIVYTDADGNLIRLTRDDFTSEEEFLHWKVWSDENFHCEEKNDHRQTNHTISLDDVFSCELTTPGMDELIESSFLRERQKAERKMRIESLRSSVTKKQFRRLWMYYVEEKSEEEIALAEGVKQSSISDSISRVRKKFFETSKKTL